MDQTTDLDTALGFVIGRIEEEATRSGGMGIQSSPFLNVFEVKKEDSGLQRSRPFSWCPP